MKNLLIGIMIIGTLAAIGAAIFGLTERAKFYQDKIKAEEEAQKAIEAKKRAAEEAAAARREKDIALEDKERAEKKMREAQEAQKQAEEKMIKADKEKQLALQAKEEALKAKMQAEIERDRALEAKKKAEEERDDALATAKVEKKEREEAEKRLIAAEEAMNNAAKQLAEIRELTKIARDVIAFSNNLNLILFPLLDAGDTSFMEGLNKYAKAETREDQLVALKHIKIAKEKYDQAKHRLQKLPLVENIDLTREIKELSIQVAEENLASLKIVEEVLVQMMQGTPSEEEKQKKYIEARRLKENADLNLIEVCNKWLKLLENHKEAFPKSQTDQINALIQKIKDRVGQSE